MILFISRHPGWLGKVGGNRAQNRGHLYQKIANVNETLVSRVVVTAEVGLLNKSSCLAQALGATKIITILLLYWVTLCCPSQVYLRYSTNSPQYCFVCSALRNIYTSDFRGQFLNKLVSLLEYNYFSFLIKCEIGLISNHLLDVC